MAINNSKKIVVLGGGTAGWMTANLLAHHLSRHGYSITVVESPDIETIGVGEGSTPHIKQFFDTLGIKESQWMPTCQATYKNGIRFQNWSTHQDFKEYFHPFPSMPDKQTAAGFLINTLLKRQGHEVVAHPDPFFLSSYLAKHNYTPRTIDGFPIQVGYGYHFDAARLGALLNEHGKRLGINHVQTRVKQVTCHPNGELASLLCDDRPNITADLFFDCSGFTSVLMQKTLGVGFHSYQQSLFNNAAIAVATPLQDPIATQTDSVAMSNGWRWKIPLTNRTGNGYVYSSAYQNKDAAETELRRTLNILDQDVAVRHLDMKVGRLHQHWYRNCVAVGLAQGFIEPLEATALHLVQETVESFISAFIAGNHSSKHQEQFNQRINNRFDGIKDYIVCHYKVNSRKDSHYWRDNRNNTHISSSLSQILDCWQRGGDLNKEVEDQQIGHYYSAISWHCLLAGYGHYKNIRAGNAPSHEVNIDEVQHFIKQCAKGFISSKQLYQQLPQ